MSIHLPAQGLLDAFGHGDPLLKVLIGHQRRYSESPSIRAATSRASFNQLRVVFGHTRAMIVWVPNRKSEVNPDAVPAHRAPCND
jgi:hypothetical protein